MGILEQVIGILGQIIGFFFAYHLLRLAYKLFSKARYVGAALVAWAAAFVLLCSLPWFQVWAKSFIESNITSRLTAFGHQVNTIEATTMELHNQLAGQQTAIDNAQQVLGEVRSNLCNTATNVTDLQAATAELRGQLAGHQTAIDTHKQQLEKVQGELRDAAASVAVQQSRLTNQLDLILSVQSELTRAGTNASAQAKKLSEVEIMVKNLYGITTNDPSKLQNTNLWH